MRNGINNYFELKLDSFWANINQFIVKVKLGSRCPQNKETLLAFLEKNGVNLTKEDILMSEIKII